MGAQFGKAVAGGRAKELAAVVDAAVGVLVDGEKTGVGADKVDLLGGAVAVEVKGEFGLR